jgi:hypothetical protein
VPDEVADLCGGDLAAGEPQLAIKPPVPDGLHLRRRSPHPALGARAGNGTSWARRPYPWALLLNADVAYASTPSTRGAPAGLSGRDAPYDREQRCAAGRHRQLAGQPSACPTTQRHRDRLQIVAGQTGALGMTAGQSRDLFGEGLPGAVRITAVKPVNDQLNKDLATTQTPRRSTGGRNGRACAGTPIHNQEIQPAWSSLLPRLGHPHPAASPGRSELQRGAATTP